MEFFLKSRSGSEFNSVFIVRFWIISSENFGSFLYQKSNYFLLMTISYFGIINIIKILHVLLAKSVIAIAIIAKRAAASVLFFLLL